MQNRYKQILLGSEAKEYMVNQLKKGHTFGKLLSRKVARKKGRISTILPISLEIGQRDLLKFSDPELSPQKERKRESNVITIRDDIALLMATFVFDFLGSKANSYAIFEDYFLKPSDGCFDSIDIPMKIKNDEIFYCINKGANKQQVKKTIDEGHNFYPGLIGALIDFRKGANKFGRNQRENITESQLKSLVTQTEKIILGAYDGEGYLIWECA